MPQRLRDILLFTGAVVAAVCAGAVVRQLVEPRWEFMLGFAALFVACAGVKLRWPGNAIMRNFSWPYVILVFVLAEAAALLLADWNIVGAWWTIPAVVCLGLAYCFVHMVYGPRRG